MIEVDEEEVVDKVTKMKLLLSTPLTWNYLGSIFSIPGILELHDITYDFVVTQKGVNSSTSMIFKYYPMSESVNIYEWLS